MWKCPRCNRKFRTEDQWHSCTVLDLDFHFVNKDKSIRAIFDKIASELQKFGPLEIIPVKSSIQFKAGANFASLKIKKTHIDLGFQLGREVEILPVTVYSRISSKRVYHVTTIDHIEQVDNFLIGLLQESYELVSCT